MTRHPEWLLTPERAAVYLPTATVVIADLHLGYAQSRQRRGEAVPPVSLEQSLAALRCLKDRQPADQLVIAGDLFEDAAGELLADWAAELLRWLDGIGMKLAGIVPGNHDRGLHSGRSGLPIFPDGVMLGDWRVVHGDGPLPAGRLAGRRGVVQGHIHPCVRWRDGIAMPCFLERADHLVLPAFSADAAGVNVLRDPRWQSYGCHLIAGTKIFAFGELGLLKRKR